MKMQILNEENRFSLHPATFGEDGYGMYET